MDETPRLRHDQPKATPDTRDHTTASAADGSSKGRADHGDAAKAADAQRARTSAETARFRDAYLAAQKSAHETATASHKPDGSTAHPPAGDTGRQRHAEVHDAGRPADSQHHQARTEPAQFREAYLASQRPGQTVAVAPGVSDAAAAQQARVTPGESDLSPGQEIRQAVRDAKALGLRVDVEAHPHELAPDVRAEKGVKGTDFQSAHVGPTSALRETSGYIRGEALTAFLSRETHQAFDKQWLAVFRGMANKGRTEMTVQELYTHVADAIRSLPDETQKARPPVITARQKGTLEFMLHRELYGHLGLSPDDKVRMPYAKGPMGSGPADKRAPKPVNAGPRLEPKVPALNERGEVIGSKAEGATAKMEAREAAQRNAERPDIASNPRADPPKAQSPEAKARPEQPAADAADAAKAQTAKSEIPRSEAAASPLKEHGDVTHGSAPGYPAGPEAAEAKAAAAAGGVLERALGVGGKVLGGLGKIAGVAGNVFDAIQMYFEGREVIARERPDLLPEGTRVALTMHKDQYNPASPVPTGYTVEKVAGRVIYRNENGTEVTREEAIKKSSYFERDLRNRS